MTGTGTQSGVCDLLEPLSERELAEWRGIPARQQPVWEDTGRASDGRHRLTALPPLVRPEEIVQLGQLLDRCASGALSVVQVGNCAEEPRESDPHSVERMAGLIDALAATWQLITGRQVVRVGRMAGQYAKPRSEPMETVEGRQIAVYRGHMVNRPGATEGDRRHLSDHMMECYRSAGRVLAALNDRRDEPASLSKIWTSHEALVLDYELGLLRRDAMGRLFLTSTHWPWVGERTRQIDHAHVRLLAAIHNPVACKIGPSATPRDVRNLCRVLNSRGQPGRLTLISRMGAEKVEKILPPLVAAARDAKCPVLWMCDPMHANTRRQEGTKIRVVEDITTELRRFHHCVTAAGGVPAGIHLEATPADVGECVSAGDAARMDPRRYTTLCDPRLNPMQAQTVLWAAASAVAGGPCN
ncbi:3-deoxy-D-arabinoheptulosonate-7-phosphate synthase [Streptomyces sp. BK208]|uniref:3-deoxy-7-phosphoheptulonate synthase n=1 Tax=Streptomyces sp. BK208 TaxID=2512150 RepID=UPI00105BB7D7|nr:3-deoxy-7-phosphoheptulonate synthase [Streptomyces sp. BK208]TDT25913.1 3-deoxy-D-arabinoheptulosonate-7-phosphate synthase [Streptomyces sp. BK208]